MSMLSRVICCASTMRNLLSMLLLGTGASFSPLSITRIGSGVDRRLTRNNDAITRTQGQHQVPTQLQASLEAILFDCDGVLADTERDGHR